MAPVEMYFSLFHGRNQRHLGYLILSPPILRVVVEQLKAQD